MDALEWLRKHLDADGSDLLREMVRTFAERLMAAEVDVLCGAGYGEVSQERVNSRNGYRPRQLDTRVGSIDLAIPKLREGSYYPGWLLEPRRRAERALVAVVAECYVRGVSTRRVEGLVQTLGVESLSKSQVSRMATELDGEVAAFRSRPLDGGPYTYVSLDAMTQKVREGGRIVNVAVVIAVGVNAQGHREVLGLDIITTEDGAGWLAFLRGLVARGLAGTTLVISDAHPGLVDAVAATMQGAGWQRSSVHHPPRRLVAVEASTPGGMVPLVTPRRWERALAA
jgi:transposase-like protein